MSAPAKIYEIAGQQGMPAAPEHERSVLGTALVDVEALDALIALLDDADFSVQPYRRIFGTAKCMRLAGYHVDRVTLSQRLLESGKLAEVGGMTAIANLDPLPRGAGIFESYCATLRKLRIRRAALIEAENLKRLALEGGDSEELITALQRSAETLSGQNTPSGGLLRLDEVFARDFENWNAFTGRQGSQPAIPLPFAEPLSGFRIGEYTILAARPGDGKSAAAANFIVHAARNGFAGQFWSLEMKSGSILRRMVAGEAHISQWKLANGRSDEHEDKAAWSALSSLCKLPIWMHDRYAGTSVDHIRNQLRRAAARNECPALVVVDYLQLLHAGGGYNRNEEIGRISRGLKSLTLDFPIALLALSQLSRDSEKEGKREPRLSDLRDSGSLEQDADNVVFLHPSGSDDVNAKVREVRWIVRKQRNGHVGAVQLAFHRDQLRFSADVAQ